MPFSVASWYAVASLLVSAASAAGPVAPGEKPLELAPTLVVVAPHPDDETLGFGGLIHDALHTGRNVRAVIVTDGQSYCRACALWQLAHPPAANEACSMAQLDAFGTWRRHESAVATAHLGLKEQDVVFLGHVDGSLHDAADNPDVPPARPSCDASATGPTPTGKTGTQLIAELRAAFVAAPGDKGPIMVFTTHAQDGHPDHAALEGLVRAALADLPRPATLYTAVIHSHALDQCAYPAPPQADTAICKNGDSDDAYVNAHLGDISRWRAGRLHPDTPWEAPTDLDYGVAIPWPLSPSARIAKRRAIAAYKSQIGTVTRQGVLDARYAGWVDSIGYLNAFDHPNELFFHVTLPSAAIVQPAPIVTPAHVKAIKPTKPTKATKRR